MEPEALPEQTRYTPNKPSSLGDNTYNSTRRVDQERSAEREEKSPLSNQADGELDQLTQKVNVSLSQVLTSILVVFMPLLYDIMARENAFKSVCKNLVLIE